MNETMKNRMLNECIRTPKGVSFYRDAKTGYIKIQATLTGTSIQNLGLVPSLKDGSLENEFAEAISSYFSIPKIIAWMKNTCKYNIPSHIRFYGSTMVNGKVIATSIETMLFINLNYAKCSVIAESTIIKQTP